MKKNSIKILSIFCIVIVMLTTIIYGNSAEKVEVTFSSAVDGDTAKFNLNNEVITVRFLAVDTPETKHPTKGVEPFGKEASEFTKEKLSNAKKIVIEYDSNSDKTDKYDRHLAWVWVDDELLQELLIKNGLAKVAYLYGDYKYVDKLKQEEQIAKENKVGLWQEEQQESTENEYEDEIVNEVENEVNTETTQSQTGTKEIIYSAIAVIIFLISAVFGKKKIKRRRKR